MRLDRAQAGADLARRGELILASTGALLGRAEAVMVLRDQGHFERHRAWLAEQDAIGER